MTELFQKLFARYPVKMLRALEIFPGLFVWIVILSPLWGSLLFPTVLAYFILFFDVYWFYKSFSLVITASIATKKISNAAKEDWYKNAKELTGVHKVHHVLVMPNYKERVDKVSMTLDNLKLQTMPLKQLHIVLAMEAREDEAAEKAKILIKKYGAVFGSVIATYHPDIHGEVKGKSSNEAYAGREAYRQLIENGPLPLDFTTVSSVDADSMFDKQYFAYLTYKFLSDSNRYRKFWQSAIVFHNNIWQVPSPTRILAFFGSLWRIALLVQGDKLITQSTYSLSFKLLKEIDFWDVDVIPEDYRVFFKAFFRTKGQVFVEPLFVKTSMDAALSPGYFNSLKNKYNQERRWSWGVSDDAVFIRWWLTVPGVPFARKTTMLYYVVLDHLLWPINWFIVTIAANVMPTINPIYSRTSLGYNLPKLAGLILTSCLVALGAMLYLDYKNRPKHIKLTFWQKIRFPLEFFLMPVVGFFLSALPALISHTQLMIGKRLEYKVTEKI